MVMENIPLFKVFMSESAPDAVADVLRSGYIGEGEKVKEFEKALGTHLGNPHVLCVNSGTSAIKLGLRIAGVKAGDRVLSTPITCLATNTAILDLGAHITWIDVAARTGLMRSDLASIPIGSAILCMHWGGNPCDVKALNDYGIPVVEDACQAFGSSNIMQSKATAFSFGAIKTLTTGDGGAVVFQNKNDLERARLLKWFGLDRTRSASMRCEQDPPEAGYKMQMNDIAATIGIENLKHQLHLQAEMKVNANEFYSMQFENAAIKIPCNGVASSNWLCTVLVDDSNDFILYMKSKNISCSKVHDRNDTKKIFSNYRRDSLFGVEKFNRRHVCIPCGWWLDEEDIERIADALRSYRNGRYSCKSEKRRKSTECMV